MSNLPSAGTTMDLGGVAREFMSGRVTGPSSYAVSSIQGRVDNNYNGVNDYGGYSSGNQWSLGSNSRGTIGGKYRHYFTWYGTRTLFGGASATTGTLSGFTTLQDGYIDDGYVTVNLPFTFYIQGSGYTTAYVGSNGYITFGNASTAYSSLSVSNPPYPKIMFGSGDRNFTYVGVAYHTGYVNTPGSIALTIRIETNSIYYNNQTRGTANSVVEITLINNDNCVTRNYIGLGMDFGNFTDYGNNLFGIATASGYAVQLSGSPNYSNVSFGIYGTTSGYWSGDQRGQYWGPYPTGTD